MPDRKWLADITYIPTREGWLYLAAIMDLFSRPIVGWSMSRRMTKELVLKALAMAVEHRRPGPGLIHHSDRGSQYACGDYQQALRSHGMICSMSRKGDCWDNAPMESFCHTLKTELVHHRDYQTRNQAKADIFEYIEVFYNRSRRHSALGYMTPGPVRDDQNGCLTNCPPKRGKITLLFSSLFPAGNRPGARAEDDEVEDRRGAAGPGPAFSHRPWPPLLAMTHYFFILFSPTPTVGVASGPASPRIAPACLPRAC